jgi:NAD(P)-dependent dehydrogenase (short-subunit alcohol dehydrogenase family)
MAKDTAILAPGRNMAEARPNKDRGAVIVTGAGGTGCGRAIAARFAADGAPVVVSDVNEAGGQDTARSITNDGGIATFCRADVRDESEVRAVIAFAEQNYGGVSVLVNNASAPHGPGADLEGWADPVQTDLVGAIYTSQHAIASMRRTGGGSIVNIASISALWHGRTTPGGLLAYDVAKAGMIRMTTRLAPLAATDRIRVNCLAPGWIATDGPRQYWESLTPAERTARGVPSVLLSTTQIVAAVVRLARDESLAGRILVWWSEGSPRLIEWGDRGYERWADISL